MNEPKSFYPSDFSLRDVPGFLVSYVIISAICVLCGLTLEGLPPFWAGMTCVMGIGLLGAMMLLGLATNKRNE